jgi:glycosyltransferase involved in cell wall biosynthesis
LYKWILPRSDHIFVQSELMKRNVCAHDISPDKVSPIVTGFGLGEILPANRQRDIASDSTVTLAYLGTLNADRHLEILLDMLVQLRRDGIDARLLLVGHADKPQDRLMLEQRAKRCGVSGRVEFTGLLPQREALHQIARADICLSPIYPSQIFDMGSPTKLIEYLALGMPVVANNHPEQKLILRECRAGVYVPWNARHFARAVRWIAHRTPTERAAMGARGRAWVEANRTYASIANEVERTLIAVIERPSMVTGSRSGEITSAAGKD